MGINDLNGVTESITSVNNTKNKTRFTDGATIDNKEIAIKKIIEAKTILDHWPTQKEFTNLREQLNVSTPGKHFSANMDYTFKEIRNKAKKQSRNDLSYKKNGYKNEDWLKEMYIDNGLTLQEISEYTSVTDQTILIYMEKFGIERRASKKENVKFNKYKAIELYNDGMKISDIKEELDTSYNKVYRVINSELSEKERRASHELHKTEINTNDKENMAYFIGVMMGDGWRFITKQNNGHRIGLEVTDKKFMLSFNKCLKDIGLNTQMRERDSPKGKQYKTKYEVIVTSKNLYEWCEEINSDINKIKNIIFDSEQTCEEFIRGIYESEGTFEDKGNGIQCVIPNTNKDIITITQEACKFIGYDFNRYGPYERTNNNHKDIEILSLTKEKEVKEFTQQINPVIERKIYD